MNIEDKMASVDVGMMFSSYEELMETIDEYQRQLSFTLSLKESRTIQSARKRISSGRYLNEALKYYELCFACGDCVKNKSWIKSATENVNIDHICEWNIRIVATKDGNSLEVRRVNEKHNHPTGKLTMKQNPILEKFGGQKRPIKSIEFDTSNVNETPSPRQKRNRSLNDLLDIGKQAERWKNLKRCLNVNSDESFAEIVLNHFQNDFERQAVDAKCPPLTQLSSSPGNSSATNSLSFTVKKELFQDSDQEVRNYVQPNRYGSQKDNRYSLSQGHNSTRQLFKSEPKVITCVTISDSEEDEAPEVKPEVRTDFCPTQAQNGSSEVKPCQELITFISNMEKGKLNNKCSVHKMT